MSRNRTPRPFSQRSASAESPTSTRAMSGSPRPSVTRSRSAANSVYGGKSVTAWRSSSSTRSSRSGSPPCSRRIAPAVNAEFPPAHSRAAFSSTSTDAPRSRAASAADMPALPAPTTITSTASTSTPLPRHYRAIAATSDACRHAPRPPILRRSSPELSGDGRGLRRHPAARLRAARQRLGRDRGAARRPRAGDAAGPAARRSDRPHQPARLRDRRRRDRRARLRRPRVPAPQHRRAWCCSPSSPA